MHLPGTRGLLCSLDAFLCCSVWSVWNVFPLRTEKRVWDLLELERQSVVEHLEVGSWEPNSGSLEEQQDPFILPNPLSSPFKSKEFNMGYVDTRWEIFLREVTGEAWT